MAVCPPFALAAFLNGFLAVLNGNLKTAERTRPIFAGQWVRFATQAPDFCPVLYSMCPSLTAGGTHQPPTINKFLLFA
jgi:hypothetical protein